MFPVWCKDEPLRSSCRAGFAQVSRTGFAVYGSIESLKEPAWSMPWDSVHSCATAGTYFCLRVKERSGAVRRVKTLMFRMRREQAVNGLMDAVEARLQEYIVARDVRTRLRRQSAARTLGLDGVQLSPLPPDGADAAAEEAEFALETHAVLQKYRWDAQKPITTSSALRLPPNTAMVDGAPSTTTPIHMRASGSRRTKLESYVARYMAGEPQTRRELLVQES